MNGEQLAVTRNHAFNQTVTKNGVVSVKELFSDVMKRQFDLPDESYQVPSYIGVRKPTFVHN